MRRTRARSDLEVLEEDLCFTSGGLSKRNDMDASPGLRVNDGNRYALKQSEGNEALFLVMKPIVFEGVSRALKHPFHVNKIETVVLEIASALWLIPSTSV